MSFVSPEEFKKKKMGATYVPPKSSMDSSGFISPEEFKASRPAPTPVAPVVSRSPEEQQFLDISVQQMMNPMQRLLESSPVQTVEAPKQAKDTKAAKVLERIFMDNPVSRVLNYPFAKAAQTGVTDAPMFEPNQGFTLNPQLQPGTSAREEFAKRNPIRSTGDETLDKVLGGAGMVGSYLLNPASPAQGPLSLYQSPAVQHLASRLGGKLTEKLPDKGLALSRDGSRIVESLGSKAIREGTKEGITGAAYGLPYSLIQGQTSPQEIAGNIALDGGLGAGLGAIAPYAGAGVRRLLDGVKPKKVPSVPHPEERISAMSELPNKDLETANNAADSFKRQERYADEYKQAIDEQYQYLKESMASRGGVQQGTVIRDAAGDVTNRVGRISNNPQWYQDFFEKHGYTPTNKDLRELAKEHVDKGFQEDTAFVPPWRPQDVMEIDDELTAIRGALSTSDEQTRASLQPVADTLQKERDRLKRIMPEDVSALPKKSSDIQLMAATTDESRPLLPRTSSGGDSKVGETVAKKVTKRSSIIADLANELNVPIRTGRYRYKAHGVHKTKSEVVRTKLTNDLPVISHEIGHHLDKRYKLSSAQFDDELQALGQKTSAPGYSTEQVRKEGVAEFFRLMLTEPAEAQTKAPKFYDRYLQLASDVDKRALTKAQTNIRKYLDQDILTKSYSEMSVGQKDKRKLPSLQDLYTKFVDDLNPLKQKLKPLGDKGKEVYRNFWLLRGSAGRAQAFLKQGRVDAAYKTVGKSFDAILKPVKKNLNEFRTYIKDKRAVELADRKIMTGSDVTVDERIRGMEVLEQRFPQFKTAHTELKNYQDAILKELIDGGVLDSDNVKKFKEMNKEYVPFFRVFEAEAGAEAVEQAGMKSGVANQHNPIKRIKGSDREIVDPLESIIKNTYQYVAIAEKNRAMLSLVDGIKDVDGMGKLVEKIPSPMQGTSFSLEELRGALERALPEGVSKESLDLDGIASIFRPTHLPPGKENVITVFRKGKRELYQLDPDLYRVATAADKEQMHFVVRALNFPVRMLRSGVVNTLEFWSRNMFRDQYEALIKSDNGYIPYVDMIRGMYHVIGKTDTFTKFLASGGAQSLRQSLDRKYLQSDLRSMLATNMKDKSMNVFRNPLEAMRALSELSELGTRVGEFSKGVKKDSTPEGIKRAALAARDLIDFSRAGTWGKEINKLSAFWNAQVQGLDKTVRVFMDPKKAPQAFAKSLAAITAPTAGLYYLNQNDPRYQELPQWDKDLFWHFWVGDTHFRLPIPFELGVMFKVVPERLLSMADGKDDPWRGFSDTTKEGLVPAPTSIAEAVSFLSALAPLGEVMANQNFAGAPIVPRREEGLEPEDQYGPHTSSVTKGIAKLAGKVGLEDTFVGSPRKLEHVITGYTGSLGKYALQGLGAIVDNVSGTDRPSRPASGLESLPGFKAFIGKSKPENTDSIDRFYDRLDELSKAKKSADKRGTPFMGAGEADMYNKISRNIAELRGIYRLVMDDRNLSSKEKRQRLDELNDQMNELAKTALSTSKQMK